MTIRLFAIALFLTTTSSLWANSPACSDVLSEADRAIRVGDLARFNELVSDPCIDLNDVRRVAASGDARLLRSLLWQPGIYGQGEQAPQSRQEFCKGAHNPEHAFALLRNDINHLAFVNDGGLINGGVCWWHSRFTRLATYLAIFRPELPKPTRAQAVQIINRIAAGKTVVLVPGFYNLSQFSFQFHDLIQRKLNRWQLSDGILRMAWIKALSGKGSASPGLVRERMDALYRTFTALKQILYVRLPLKGQAHAVLILGMVPTSGGYRLELLDSNALEVLGTEYKYGMTRVPLGSYNSLPYLDAQNEMQRINHTIRNFCAF